MALCLVQVVSQVNNAVEGGAKLVLRFEPFILAVEARNIAAAAQVLQAGRIAGFRESGMTLGADGKRIMVRAAFKHMYVMQ